MRLESHGNTQAETKVHLGPGVIRMTFGTPGSAKIGLSLLHLSQEFPLLTGSVSPLLAAPFCVNCFLFLPTGWYSQ